MSDKQTYTITLDGKHITTTRCEVVYGGYRHGKTAALFGKTTDAVKGSFTMRLGEAGRELFDHLQELARDAAKEAREAVVIVFSDKRSGFELGKVRLSDVDDRVDLQTLLLAITDALSPYERRLITDELLASTTKIIATEVRKANEAVR